jgi:hypothetical protein
MLRYLGRIEYETGSSTEYDDNLWAFFQACWHLKDWIKNDDTVDAPVRGSIEAAVIPYRSIMVSADLANATKHLKLKSERNRTGANVISRSVNVNLGDLPQSSSSHQIELGDGTILVAQEVAKRAVEEWTEILKKNGLM